VLESNRLYDWPDRRLKRAGRALRIRRAEATTGPPDHRPTGEVTVTVTAKGPRRPGKLKIRDERECYADDADAVAAVFELLGLACTIRFEKRRATWTLDGCTVVVDELPHLGHFMEIEGPTEDAVTQLARRLGLDDDAVVPHTYSRMLTRYCKAHGLDRSAITF